jgi:tRNA dimethylallyltransferase
VPLVVGGAGFYLHVLREGLFAAPFGGAELRRVRQALLSWSTEALREELARRDPRRLAAIHPNDRYRLSRALEICIASGTSVTALTAARPRPARRFLECRLVVERDELHRRIAARTARLLEGGWIDEVRALLERGVDPGLPGLRTLGYPHVVDLVRGRTGRALAEERVNRDTRRFARRQETWFRKAAGAVPLPAGDPGNAGRLEALLGSLVPR